MKCARLKSDTAVSELVEKKEKYETKHKRLVHQEFRHDCCWLVKFCWFYFLYFSRRLFEFLAFGRVFVLSRAGAGGSLEKTLPMQARNEK